MKKLVLCFTLGAILFSQQAKAKENISMVKGGFLMGAGIAAGAAFFQLIAKLSDVYIKYTLRSSAQLSPKSKISLADISTSEETLLEARKLANYLQNSAHYNSFSARPPKGIIISGPARSGKTLLAQAIAGEAEANFISLNGYDVIGNRQDSSGTIITGAAVVNNIFQYAKACAANAPTVIFIDNIDVVAGKDVLESEQSFGFSALKNEAIYDFIKQMDDLPANIMVIATSYNPAQLHKGLTGTSRLDKIIKITYPVKPTRKLILKKYISSKEILSKESVEELKKQVNADAATIEETIDGVKTALIENYAERYAEETGNFTEADIEAFINKAAIIALNRGSSVISSEDLEEAFETISIKIKSSQGITNTTTFKDVIGLNAEIEEIEEIVNYLKNPENYIRIGAKIPRGILFEGPPGTGKTLLARAVAQEANANFIHRSGSSFINKYVGVGADNVRKTFLEAKETEKPTIIFIDEIDAIGKRSGLGGGGGDSEYRQTINELLTQMDGFNQNDNIIIIAATNDISNLDDALLRPGRFDRKIHISLPQQEGRKDILEHYLSKITISENLNVDAVAEKYSLLTTGFSGAELENIVAEAARLAARKNEESVASHHIDAAYDRILLGLEKQDARSTETIKRIAYHEAGHAAITLLRQQPMHKVTILARGTAGGVSIRKLTEELADRDTLLSSIMISQGGMCAEQLLFKNHSEGVSSDLQHAQQMAEHMVKQLGMGEGILEGATISATTSQKMMQRFDEEVLKILDKCRNATKSLLNKKRKLLDELAQELLKKETLNEDEIYEIAKHHDIQKKD